MTHHSFASALAVKPDATPEEVRAVVENDGGGQVFQQAVSKQVQMAEVQSLTPS